MIPVDASGPGSPLRVAYLVNRYPAVSHTFIRREIHGLEASGLEVLRFSIRRVGEGELVDARDIAEQQRTTVLLDEGFLSLVISLFVVLLRGPLKLFRALRLAWRLGGRSPRGRLLHLAYLGEAVLLFRRLRAARADHLHAHFGTNPATVALLCRILGGPRFSFTVHGPEEFDRPEALGLREKIQAASFVAAVSDFGRGQLMRWSEESHWGKLRLIRCGVDEVFLEAPEMPVPDRPRLTCVGRLCVDKGQLLLVEAASRLVGEYADLEIVLVGTGESRPQIEERIRQLRLEGRIQVRGALDGEGVRLELLQARGLVLPSLAEGLPVVIMEALGLGRPVISTFVAGIPELVKPGISGWLVPAGNVEALVEAIREVLRSPVGDLARFGRNGREMVRARHDSRKEAARLAEVFRASGSDRVQT